MTEQLESTMTEVVAVPHSPFIAALVNDPAIIPDLMMLWGYPGASSKEQHTRLYTAADLSDYYDIPTDQILHAVEIPLQQNPLGAVYLWMKKDARLTRKGDGGTAGRAGFFSGDIQNAYVNGQANGTAQK